MKKLTIIRKGICENGVIIYMQSKTIKVPGAFKLTKKTFILTLGEKKTVELAKDENLDIQFKNE